MYKMFPDEVAKERGKDFPIHIKLAILQELGAIAIMKYDDFITDGITATGYNIGYLRGCLRFSPNVKEFDNDYWLQGNDQKMTNVANYFEYGTGEFNTGKVSRSSITGRFQKKGPIRPKRAEYMKFVSKYGKWFTTKEVKGVRPIAAMEKALAYVRNTKVRDVIEEKYIPEIEETEWEQYE